MSSPACAMRSSPACGHLWTLPPFTSMSSFQCVKILGITGKKSRNCLVPFGNLKKTRQTRAQTRASFQCILFNDSCQKPVKVKIQGTVFKFVVNIILQLLSSSIIFLFSVHLATMKKLVKTPLTIILMTVQRWCWSRLSFTLDSLALDCSSAKAKSLQ